MTTKYGMFSEPGYLRPGGNSNESKKDSKVTEMPPPNVKTPVGKCGKGRDATFDRFKPLFEKEPYEAARDKRGKKLDNPWKTPSPTKKHSGLGDYWGTIGYRYEYIAVGCETDKGEPGPTSRSIYTSPGKKGSYGTHRTTLSQIANPQGVVGEYAYKPDPYKSQYQVEQEEQQRQRERQMGDSSFKPPGCCKSKITGPGICGEYAYMTEGPISPRKRQSNPESIFKPSGKAKRGLSNTIGTFPEFLPDGMVDLRRPRPDVLPGDPWRPSSFPKTDCVKSIVRVNTLKSRID